MPARCLLSLCPQLSELPPCSPTTTDQIDVNCRLGYECIRHLRTQHSTAFKFWTTVMTDSSRGMPLLSGPPSIFEPMSRSDFSCRRCNKEFNIVFARDRRCNHCGALYWKICCTGHGADSMSRMTDLHPSRISLLPLLFRVPGSNASTRHGIGLRPDVCVCILYSTFDQYVKPIHDLLPRILRPPQVTAGGKGYLRTQSLARLRNYIQAYNIKIGRDILEKDEIIDAIVAARVSARVFVKAARR